jgi:hypothetical protein
LQARPARILRTQFQDARGERGLIAAAFAKRPQVAQQGNCLVVFAGLLGRDHLVDPRPGRFPFGSEFNFRDRADFELSLLWQRGDTLAAAMVRLEAVRPDESAGRAPRHAMRPEFEGMDDWIPWPVREVLVRAADEGAISLEHILLEDDAQIANPVAVQHLRGRWKPTSPLHRAAVGVIAYWEREGIDPGRCHLHGADLRDRDTQHFAGFGLRYFHAVPSCLTEFDGVEWVEVVHPTRAMPLLALRIRPLDRTLLRQRSWS